MAIGTYFELRVAVQTWLADAGSLTTDRALECIQLAEGELNLRLAQMELTPMTSRVASALTGDTLTTPVFAGGFLRPMASQITFVEGGQTVKRPVDYVTPENLVAMAEAGASDGCDPHPAYFTYIDGAFQFFPAPANGAATYPTAYTFQLTALARLVPLSDSAPTNWLLATWPNIYLVAALAQAEAFGWNDARASGFDAKLDQQLTLLARAYPKPTDHRPLRSDVPNYRRIME